MMCSAGEISGYVNSLVQLIGNSDETAQPLSNINCNLTNWSQGCEDGWARSAQNVTSISELYQNVTTTPLRVGDPYRCCGGFFCPRGLSCMIREYSLFILNANIHTPMDGEQICSLSLVHKCYMFHVPCKLVRFESICMN